MRQPAQIYVTPSNPSPWYGAAGEGDQFTQQQLAEMERLGLEAGAVEVLRVKRSATDKEEWIPVGATHTVFEFDCPVIGRRTDGRIKATKRWAPDHLQVYYCKQLSAHEQPKA